MTHHDCHRPAPGGPGLDPRWTRGDKDAVGTAYSTSSPIWYTLSRGLLNEIYYPTIDRPQIRDVQYLVTDGKSFFHDERRDLEPEVEMLSDYCLGVRVTTHAPDDSYRIVKEIITNPHEPCLLVRTRVEGDPDLIQRLRLYVLCAPHLEVGGAGNTAEVVTVAERQLLFAHKNNTCLAVGASVPFRRCSVGYVGVNDGWTDLHDDFTLDWTYDCARDGNVALTGELAFTPGEPFTLAIAFGQSFHHAVTTLFQSLGIPYEQQRQSFLDQWERAHDDMLPLGEHAGDGGHLYHRSHSLLLAHEDKRFPGALIASMSIPWGQVKGDEEGDGGYHLVWTRDMVNSALGLMAAGETATPIRALIYLAVSQRADGGFAQNFWVDGEPYWDGIQLDEVAFPILLAWRLHEQGALKNFDPHALITRAAGYLIRRGPVTPQERWEEASGYSPSTLAVTIAALTCAASFLHERGDDGTARFVQEHADFLESHVEAWTVTTEGELHPDIARHYIRITPVDAEDPVPNEDPNTATLYIANHPPGADNGYPARNVVDAGFLELVRYGVRRADDPLIVDSLRVVDAVLKVETPFGPCWHRYNHDGYGQRPDGGPFKGWGKGRAWPLLTVERGHYELAAGRDATPYLRTLERFAHGVGLLTEQVWDEADMPQERLFCGRPTGAAMPLMWAHAEYIKLLRSIRDGEPFDRVPQVVDRYQNGVERTRFEVWKPNRRVQRVRPGWTLRVQLPHPFRLRWSDDGERWQTTRATDTTLDISYVDLPVAADQRGALRFGWLDEEGNEGEVQRVEIEDV